MRLPGAAGRRAVLRAGLRAPRAGRRPLVRLHFAQMPLPLAFSAVAAVLLSLSAALSPPPVSSNASDSHEPNYAAGYNVRLTTDATSAAATKMRIKVDDHDVSIFDVVWNSDLSLHCQSINQTLRLEGNGVRANAKQAWFGGVMNTLYGAGNSMPSAAGANSSLLNGGIPQLADRSLILHQKVSYSYKL